MKPEFSPLFQPYTFNNGVTVKNRLSVAPMTHWSSDENGHATEAELNYIRPRATGFGLFITASTAVNWQGRGFIGEPNAISEADIASLKQVAQTIQQQGALAILQLHHAGKEVATGANRGDIVAPSDDGKARAITQDEIYQTIQDYANATELALLAGFDGIELHGANNYLLQQFISRKHNRRTDEFGGSLENRLRFPSLVVKAVSEIKQKHQRNDFIIGYRITPEEAGEEGLTMTDTLALIDEISRHSLQYVHISLQDFYNKARRGADTNLSRLEIIKAHLQGKEIALIGVGKLATPQKALTAFNTGWVDFVAIGLGVLANPNFVALIESGQEQKALKMFKLSRGAKYHQMPQPMWDMIMTFVPKPVVAITKFWGKLWGWQ